MLNKMSEILLQTWSEQDLALMQRLLGSPTVMAHLGGPETPEQIERRNKRYAYLVEDGVDQMYKIVLASTAEPVGSIGYWKKNWRDRLVYEMGWMVLPEYQGHGIATKAGEAVIDLLRKEKRFPFIHAFPSVSNPASNAICRKLGFTLLEECQFDYPPGHSMTVNDWQLDLSDL
jgi:RimJ/RimL family protein N-acetyltransferase